MQYKIKQIPEDFKVEEINNELVSGDWSVVSGKYGYFVLDKKILGTLDTIEKIARTVGINPKRIGFAGNKDKNAITRQFISVDGLDGGLRKKLEGIKTGGIRLEFVGYGNKRICLGDLQGNKFEIVIRNLDKKFKINKIKFVENYFDEQRFGFNGKNCDVGRAIVKGDSREACRLLSLKGQDYINLLSKIGTRRLRFYIHAYQSYLWNCVLNELVVSGGWSVVNADYCLGKFVFLNTDKCPGELKKLGIPLLNFDTKIIGKIGRLYKKIMEKEGIKQEDFIFRSMPELIAEGVMRRAVAEVKDFGYRFERDELNKGKYKATLQFNLPAGSYATMVVRRLFYN